MSERRIRKRKASRRSDQARPAFGDFAQVRIRWLDRLAAVIVEMPGPPPATAVNQTCVKLLKELESYRDGFVHALNISRMKR